MKKIVLLITSLLIVWTASAERVSPDEAAVVANHFMNGVSASAQGVHKAPAKRIVLQAAAQDTAAQYYVYENTNGEGWVMVAANDVVRPVLAYSHTGRFRTDHMPNNVRGWLREYNKQIRFAEQNYVNASPEVQQEWTALRKGIRKAAATEIVTPLIQTGWDQGSPYWNLCPVSGTSRTYTGCVATAMAQVMYYWQWPQQGTGSHSVTYKGQTYTANFGETTYDWANMLKSYSGSSTSAQKTAVATLMLHCGIAVDMEYGTYDDGGSAAYTIDYNGYFSDQGTMCAETALRNFFKYKTTGYCRDGDYGTGMKKWSRAEWIAMLKAELDAARPIMYAGVGCDDPKDSQTCYGHSFVCDGYDSDDYFHFNWGWSNWCDGYYNIDVMETTDPGSGGGNGVYNLQQDVILLQPDIPGHTVVVNGSGCTITPGTSIAENGKAFTVTITPTDGTYDFTSMTVQLGSTTLTEDTHYTLSEDHKTLTILASAITGSESNNLIITAVWTKNRYKYDMLGENCDPEIDEGMLAKNASLELTILPLTGYTLADAECWDVEMGGEALTYGSDFTYNTTTGAFAIAEVTGDVNILAYGAKAITWMANGELFATNLSFSNKLTVPDSQPADCEEMVFIGWTATSDYSHATVAPTMVKNGDEAAATTYYAVYATEGESTEYSIEKATSIAVGDQVILVCSSISKELSGIGGSSTQYGEGTSYTGTPVGVYLLDVVAGSTAGTFALKHGNVYLQWTSGNSLDIQTNIDKNSSWTITFSSGNAIIRNAEDATRSIRWNANSPRFACYTSTQTAVQLYRKTSSGGSYSDYTTSPNCQPKEPVYYTVAFYVNGVKESEQQVLENTEAEVPEMESECGEYSFVGWWTEELTKDNTEAKTWITDFTATQNQNYYAVFSKTDESGETLVSDTLTRTTTGRGTTGTYGTWSDKTANSDAVYAGNSAGGNDYIQLRSNNENSGIITTTSGGKIKKVTVKWNSDTQSGRTLNVYGKNSAYSSASDLYTGSAGTLIGTIVKGTSTELNITGDYKYVGVRSYSGAMYMNSITFTWAVKSVVTYYTTDALCSPTEIPQTQDTQPAAIKTIRNGQLYLIYQGATYNIQGVKVN